MLAAINCEEADHVPFVPSFIGPWVDEYWHGKGWMVDMLKMGLDQCVSLGAPWRHHPDVKVRRWEDRRAEHRYPLLVKVYETPAGELRQVVNRTDDWPHGDDIPLLSDFIVPGGRSVEFLIKGAEDVEKLRYLLWEPSGEQVLRFHEGARGVKALAERNGLLIDSGGGYGGTYLPQLCGLQSLLVWIAKQPQIVKRLLEIVHEWDMRRVRLLLEERPDMVTRDGWYDSPTFWSIRGFKEFLEPLVREEAELVHRSGAKFRYIMAMGNMPLADTLKDMDIDVLFGIDPIAERESPQNIRRRLGPDMCLWAGINENVIVQQGTRDEVRGAVIDAIRAFAPGGGYVLSTIGSMLQKEGWERNGPAMIDAWRQFGNYPMG